MSSTVPKALRRRLAAAPISWGVCEIEGWGNVLPPDHVLGEMASLGFGATELGPDDYLPADPEALRDLLEHFGLRVIGGFVPLVIGPRGEIDDALRQARRAAGRLAAIGADVLVSSVSAVGRTGTDPGLWREVDADGARVVDALLELLDKVEGLAAAAGLGHGFHPHAGTLVDSVPAVEAVLERSGAGICLDTGHLALAGCDPWDIAACFAQRIRHVHLKDVDIALAEQLRTGTVTFPTAVALGLFKPLGDGDISVQEVITTLEEARYSGWYVLEQDVVVKDRVDARRVSDDTRRSITTFTSTLRLFELDQAEASSAGAKAAGRRGRRQEPAAPEPVGRAPGAPPSR